MIYIYDIIYGILQLSCLTTEKYVPFDLVFPQWGGSLAARSTKHIHLLVYLTAGTLGLKYGPFCAV